jgi:ABC-2 type transport system permease protein
MRVLLALIIKEFHQIRREPMTIRMIFVMPVIMLVLLGSAITTDINHLATSITDLDNTPLSRSIIESFSHTDLFDVLDYPTTYDALETALQKGAASVGIIIPRGFARKIYRNESSSIAIWIDGVDSNAGLIAGGYAAALLTGRAQNIIRNAAFAKPLPPEPRFEVLYNPELESRMYMVPGIVAVIVLMTTSIFSSMSIVREREVGTLEQLMVTPIKIWQLMLGKLLPFLVIGFFEIMFALLLGIVIFSIPFKGSIILLLALSIIYLLTTLGAGLFVSTITSTQQQAMFFSWFFNLFALIMSGFMFPIANMPVLLQRLTLINPLRYFITVIREIVLKGATFSDLLPEISAMVILSGILFTTAAIRFNKRVE